MGITAKELAQILNLSAAAVSMALNNKPGISTETKKRVLETAQKLDYDLTRHTFHPKDVKSIYLIIYKKHGAIVGSTPFFQELSEGIAAGCQKNNYKMEIRYLYGEEGNTENRLKDILYSGCTGIILLGTEMTPEDYLPFRALTIPIVLLDSYFETAPCDSIIINNIQGAFLAASHLIKTTEKQPGYLHSSYPIGNFAERHTGFFKAIHTYGMAASNSIVHSVTPSIEGAYADMLEILKREEPLAPCYFADNDLIALGALKAFKQHGYRIPEDISIVGFDDIPAGVIVDPALTTIHVPKHYMGKMAANRLISRLEEPDATSVKLEIATSLIRRHSA
ncbi:MAG: LacI family DNA-binding transcriptional regulator [Lacrimispora sp.]